MARLRDRLILVVGLAALVGVGVLLIAASESSDGGDSAPDTDVEEPAPEENEPPPADGEADAIDPGGPLDGLESLQLPISVTPSDGLVDLDWITVSGSGFTPGATIAMVQCWLTETGGTRDDCDLGNIGVAFAESDGTFSQDMQVHRVLDTINGVRDCGQGSEATGCRIGVGNTEDLDESGGAPIFFVVDAGAPAPPTITVAPLVGLVDGQPISVSGTGFEPGSIVVVTQCPVGGQNDASNSCLGRNPGVEITMGADGDLSVEVPARRITRGVDGDHDCGLEVHGCMLVVRVRTETVVDGPCPSEEFNQEGEVGVADARAATCPYVVWADGRSPNPVPLVFDAGAPPPLPPEYTVSPTADLVDGSVVRLEVFDMPADGSFTVSQCADGGPRGLFCAALGSIEVSDGDGGVDLIVRRELTLDDDVIDCAERGRICYLELDGDLTGVVRGPLRFAA